MSKQLSVIIPSYQRCQELPRLLASLDKQDLEPDRFEVIIMDDGSKDETYATLLQAMTSRSWLQAKTQSNSGQAAARHQAALSARGEFLLFLDDDMEPVSASFFRQHLQALAGEKKRVVFGSILPPEGARQRPAFELFYEQSLQRLAQQWQQHPYSLEGQHFFSANVSLSRELYLEVGGFDRSFRQAEDKELGIRLEKHGSAHFRYAAEAAAIHHSPTGRYTAFALRAAAYGYYDCKIFQLYQQDPRLDPKQHWQQGPWLKKLAFSLSYHMPLLHKLSTPLLSALAESCKTLGLLPLAIRLCSTLYIAHYARGIKKAQREAVTLEEKPAGQSLLYDVKRDLTLLLAYENRPWTTRTLVWAFFACDAFAILLSFRLRQFCSRYHLPLIPRILRGMQTAFYGIELGSRIELGHGVYFVHPVGIVIGGDARVEEGCVFFGSNTVGAAKFEGCPRIGAYTVMGAGARVLGSLSIGEQCFIGANAVVVHSLPAGKVAVGIPAEIIADNELAQPLQRMQKEQTQFTTRFKHKASS